MAGITTATSDKAFKKAEHRRERRALLALDLTENDPPARKAFGNPWGSEKDGKARFNPNAHPDLLRK